MISIFCIKFRQKKNLNQTGRINWPAGPASAGNNWPTDQNNWPGPTDLLLIKPLKIGYN